MSWNTGTGTSHYKGSEAVSKITQLENVCDEALEQFEVAKDVAQNLIDSGAVGDPSFQYRIAIGGHANTKHEPDPSWADDFVTVRVEQVGPPANLAPKE